MILKKLRSRKFIVLVLLAVLIGGVMVLESRNKEADYFWTDQQLAAGFLEITSCLSFDSSNKNDCYDEFLSAYGKDKEISQLLAEMEAARPVSQEVELECHPIAHAIGREALKRYETVGDAFRSCDFSCYSGCYHGVMERLFFTENEILEGVNHLSLSDLSERVPNVCNASQFENPTNIIIFQCLHGTGHAVLYSLNYDLQEALEACDFFSTQYEQSSCYGGVFMENITAFDPELRQIDDQDPHYPCNAVDPKYGSDCYLLQTSRMLEMGYSFEEVVDLCAGAGDFTASCYMSLGRDATTLIKSTGDFERVAKLCEQVDNPSDRENCVNGVALLLLDDQSGFRNAFTFCNTLSDVDDVYLCYYDVIPYSASLYETEISELEQACEEHGDTGKQDCLAVVRDFDRGYL